MLTSASHSEPHLRALSKVSESETIVSCSYTSTFDPSRGACAAPTVGQRHYAKRWQRLPNLCAQLDTGIAQ